MDSSDPEINPTIKALTLLGQSVDCNHDCKHDCKHVTTTADRTLPGCGGSGAGPGPNTNKTELNGGYMKRRGLCLAKVVAVVVVVALSRAVSTTASQEVKITAEELVSRHLAAVGPAEAWKAAAGRAIAGWCVASFKIGGTGQADGTVKLESEGIRNMLMMRFGVPTYPHEKFAYDGKTITTGQVRPGQRSALSEFLLAHDTPLKEGLLASTLSSAWPLADVATRKAKLKYNGIKKTDGRELHEVQYNPNKSSELKILLYFDKTTFQHMRTQYRLSRAYTLPSGGAPGRESSGTGAESHYVLTEDFTDFAKEGALTLPHSYKLNLSITSGSGSVNIDWVLHLNQFALAATLDPKDFDVSK
ncbi:MAG TPA: hypothetical protein VFV34_13930 [Blastocatellia bacterium]|nr:hypothetical protein [Blastocatellia bacterium]